MSLNKYNLHRTHNNLSLASGYRDISVNFLGILSSNTTLEYHLEPHTTNCLKIGSISLPLSVSLQSTTVGGVFALHAHRNLSSLAH